MPDRTLFIGYCWGSAGTAWLAKLLNAHPDILCLHGPQFPRFNHFVLEDSLEFIRALFHENSVGECYSFVGLTHGVPLERHSHLAHHFAQMRGFITIRNPIPRIQSTFRVNMHPRNADKKRFNSAWISALMLYHEKLETISGKTFPSDYEALSFYHGCGMINEIASEVASGLPIYKYEELTTDYRIVQHLLRFISNDQLNMDQALIERMQQTPIGTRTGSIEKRSARSIHDSWNDVQREAYRWLMTDESITLYEQAGYSDLRYE
jgi:hypothetical protein